MEFILGAIFGFVCFFFVRYLKKQIHEKKGVKSKEYKNMPFKEKLRDTIRHIVFEYNIKRKNNDFLLNIYFDGIQLMQIMHRSHFPELCKSEHDVSFGLALYIPTKSMSINQIESLKLLLHEESEIIKHVDGGEISYFIVDLGNRIRFGGYLLTRIIKEVFNEQESKMSLKLFSEGELPYQLN